MSSYVTYQTILLSFQFDTAAAATAEERDEVVPHTLPYRLIKLRLEVIRTTTSLLTFIRFLFLYAFPHTHSAALLMSTQHMCAVDVV